MSDFCRSMGVPENPTHDPGSEPCESRSGRMMAGMESSSMGSEERETRPTGNVHVLQQMDQRREDDQKLMERFFDRLELQQEKGQKDMAGEIGKALRSGLDEGFRRNDERVVRTTNVVTRSGGAGSSRMVENLEEAMRSEVAPISGMTAGQRVDANTNVNDTKIRVVLVEGNVASGKSSLLRYLRRRLPVDRYGIEFVEDRLEGDMECDKARRGIERRRDKTELVVAEDSTSTHSAKSEISYR